MDQNNDKIKNSPARVRSLEEFVYLKGKKSKN